MNWCNLSRTLSCLAAILVVSPAHPENWPHWRGPAFTGAAEAKSLPSAFSKTENVKWSVDLPGAAAATPIIWGDHVFVSSTDERMHQLAAFCFDRKTGKQLWRRDVAVGIEQDDRSNYASPSPVTDGELAIFFFGNGELVAYDFDGKKIWSRNLQKDYGQFAFLWTFSSSPTIYNGTLYLQVLQRDEPVNGRGRRDGANLSYLLALDPKTGKELWKHIRPSQARSESLEAFTTPIPYEFEGRAELLIAGGDDITGHDPKTGEELWRWGTWNPNRITHWRLVPSPVAGKGIVLVCAPKGDPVYAVKAGGKGQLDDSWIAWKSQGRELSSDVSTPLFYKNRFFILNSDRKTLSCVEPRTGKIIWSGDLQSRAKIEASPTGADDKIYVMSHSGEVFVLGAGDEFKLIHRVVMAEPGEKDLRASIPVAHGDLFVRTGHKLYCIGD